MGGFRKGVVFVLALVIVAALARQYIEQLARSRAVARLLLPFRISALIARPPETKIDIPIHNLRSRQIADTWHAFRSGGRAHEGQDLFAPRGTPVYSATNGIVWRIGQAGIGGNAVSVLGASGRVYYYAHLSRFAEGLRKGDEVTPETVIGYVGNTGNARTTPPHLHFGVYNAGGAINPLPLLAERPAVSAHAAHRSGQGRAR
ncbi:MAG: peptidoglycan LD-endopeptidase LytH [Bryobacterales bacterium]|nr:peptidoglycan LD-endopeptidase LytH [Bryobacterales bacterium]